MAGMRIRLAAAVLLAELALTGCAPGQLVDRVPESLGGLPANAPARPTTPYQYPAVHDMPPARATQPMNEDELAKAQKELRAVRDRQEALAADGAPPEARKRPPAGKSGQKAGGNTGAKTNP
ncbi:MAG: hypothetical protein ACK4UO_10640 [Pseudolabrys sp.]